MWNHARFMLIAGLGTTALARGDEGAAMPGGNQGPVEGRAVPGSLGLPTMFVENQGQWETPAKYAARCGRLVAGFEPAAITLDLRGAEGAGTLIRLKFEGASPGSTVIGESRLRARFGFFRGRDPAAWRTDVPAFEGIRYEGLYNGVQVRVRADQRVLEYDVLLQPGADLSRVSLRCEGTEGLTLANDGTLVLHTELGPIHQPCPTTWEVAGDGVRRGLKCRYRLLGNHRYGFEVPGRDPRRSLVIDPTLEWSTHLGGSLDDRAYVARIGPDGTVTVAGLTYSGDFPTTPGAYDRAGNAEGDAFLARFDLTQSGADQLLWATYLAGSDYEDLVDVAVDDAGVISAIGHSRSGDFPTTPGAYDESHNGGFDAVVLRMDPSRTGAAQLLWSTFLGGTGNDWSAYRQSLSRSTSDVLTVAMSTESGDFPTTTGVKHHGESDVAIARLDPGRSGTNELVFSTLYGGTDVETAHSMAATPGRPDEYTLTGGTESGNWPTTVGAYDETYGGGIDVYIFRVDLASAGTVLYSTFLGDVEDDRGASVVVDESGVVSVGGTTRSPAFPATVGAYDESYNSSGDLFVSRLRLAGQGPADLLYSTFLGGSALDGELTPGESYPCLTRSPAGGVTLTGRTESGDFPTTRCALDATFDGTADIFVSRLSLRGRGSADLVSSTYLGGDDWEAAWFLTADHRDFPLVAGLSRSTDYPTTPGDYQEDEAGGSDAILTLLPMVTWTRYGGGWPGSTGIPELALSDYPVIGTQISLTVGNSFGVDTLGLLFLGLSEASVPTNKGGTVLVTPLQLLLLSLPAAGLSLPFAIPDDDSLCHGAFHLQVLELDPGASEGISFSQGLRMIVGG